MSACPRSRLPIRGETVHRLAASATLVTLAGLYYDGWWHGTFGRHSFWILPHRVIYGGVGLTAAVILLRWVLDRQAGRVFAPGYRVLTVAVGLTVLAAPFDDLWHRAFGVEPPTSILSFWSPPHLTGSLSAIVGGLGVLSTMVQEGGSRRFPGAMIFQMVGVIGFATFALIPFEPTSLYQVGGVLGPVPIVLVLVGLRVMAVAVVHRPGTATALALILTPLVAFLSRAPRPDTHFVAPLLFVGILALAAFSAAAVLDLLFLRRPHGATDRNTLGRWGAAYTTVFTLLFYPAANAVLRSGWSALEIAIMIAAAIPSGYGAGWAAWGAGRLLAGGGGSVRPSSYPACGRAGERST
ncbi:MAG TPA: hypothetical protein VNA31_00045 [bacterium]|nr:hypothetical protein [bacterium]